MSEQAVLPETVVIEQSTDKVEDNQKVEPIIQAEPILLIDQVGPYSSSQPLDLQLAITAPPTQESWSHICKIFLQNAVLKTSARVSILLS